MTATAHIGDPPIALYRDGVWRCAICHLKLTGVPWKFGSIGDAAISHFETEHKI